MIVLHSAHLAGIQAQARLGFHDELAAHLRAFSPALCATLKPGALEEIVRDGVVRAEHYGLTYRGPVRLFLELMLLFGAGFDLDPQYAWAGEALCSEEFEGQMLKAGRLEHLTRAYITAVSGPDGHHETEALRRLEALARRDDLQFARPDLGRKLVRALDDLFPSKFAYCGRPAAEALVERAERLGLAYFDGEPRAVALLAFLQFFVGMYCDTDPLYPWIGAALRDARVSDPKSRAAGLERRAVIWLRATNARGTA